jgi:CheY-like chemotaxis protein
VLVVEDNQADAFLIQTAIASAQLSASVHVVKDGDQAIRLFDAADRDATKPCPDIVILDINLPKKQGGDVLKYIRAAGRCRKAHVIVVSTSDSPQDRELMGQLGADAYFRKPSDYDEFMKLGELIKSVFGR